MKPEPLKGKMIMHEGVVPIFEKKDIRSAVDYLKNRIKLYPRTKALPAAKKKTMRLDVLDNMINQSFEDVFK